jgi:glycoside/pentoside/hexuronide:cation symporter, GPH family
MSSPASHPDTAPAKMAPEDRVPTREKIGYGLGSFLDMWGHWLYPGLAFQVFNIYLGVAPGLVSRALMINRVFDAVSDPVFGWLSDNTRTRFGRRRPFILVGGILAGIGLPLLFAVRQGWSEMSYFWFILISSAIFIPIMSCFNMPYQSLGTELTPDYNERTSVQSFRNAIQKLPEIAMFFGMQFTTLAIFNNADGKPNLLRGAQTYCAILGVIMILAAIGVFLLVKERYYGAVTARKQEKIPIFETIFLTLRCRPFLILLCMAMAYAMGTSMVSMLGYYNTVYYVCGGDVVLASKWNTAMGGAGMAFGLAGLPFFGWLSRRFGKRHAMICVLLAAIAAFAGTWFFYNPKVPFLQLFATGFVAFTGAGFWMLYYSMMADIMDYDEMETGKRREGSFMSCQSWITKVGIALGVGASGLVLEWTGFDAKLGGAQAPHALFMIRVLYVVIPVAGLVCGLLALLRFPLTRQRMSQIRGQLEAARGKV